MKIFALFLPCKTKDKLLILLHLIPSRAYLNRICSIGSYSVSLSSKDISFLLQKLICSNPLIYITLMILPRVQCAQCKVMSAFCRIIVVTGIIELMYPIHWVSGIIPPQFYSIKEILIRCTRLVHFA